jgi:hypothetical protein
MMKKPSAKYLAKLDKKAAVLIEALTDPQLLVELDQAGEKPIDRSILREAIIELTKLRNNIQKMKDEL